MTEILFSLSKNKIYLKRRKLQQKLRLSIIRPPYFETNSDLSLTKAKKGFCVNGQSWQICFIQKAVTSLLLSSVDMSNLAKIIAPVVRNSEQPVQPKIATVLRKI